MTFERCQTVLAALGESQGTPSPRVRVDYGGTIFQGRVNWSDRYPDLGRHSGSPFGILVLEGLGRARDPETILQIASIPDDGIRALDE